MREWLLPLLICPDTGEPLSIRSVNERRDDDILSGVLSTPSWRTYPIRNGVPRFVETHYATAFGLQWNRHARTQIDRGQTQASKDRFWGETGLTPDGIRGKLVLDGGCGAGRFTNVASRAGARVVAVDLSEAVDACYATNGSRKNVCVVQASLFNLPFRSMTFDHAFTIGVIQHTPDPLTALARVADMVKPGGELGVSWYKKYWYTYLHQKYWLRPILKRMNEERLYRFISWYVPKLLPLSRAITRLVPTPELAERFLPVANRDYISGLSEREKVEWAVLDTYDWFNPKYDKPQTWRAVERTVRDMGFIYERSPHARRGLHCRRSLATQVRT